MEDNEPYFKAWDLIRLGVMKRGAIYQAIKAGRLKAIKVGKRWKIKQKEYHEYIKTRYSRDKSIFDGELLFDPLKGEHSVKQAAKMLRITVGRVYYYCRMKRLPFKKKGHTYVLQLEDIEAFKKELRQNGI